MLTLKFQKTKHKLQTSSKSEFLKSYSHTIQKISALRAFFVS